MDNGRWGGREVGKYTLMIRQGRVRAVEMILKVKVKVAPDWSELNINRVNISQEVVKYIVEICASQEYNIKWMCLPQNSIYEY